MSIALIIGLDGRRSIIAIAVAGSVSQRDKHTHRATITDRKQRTGDDA